MFISLDACPLVSTIDCCLDVYMSQQMCLDILMISLLFFAADVTLEVSFLLAGIFLSMNIIYGRANFPISANFLPFIENVMIWKVSTDFYCIENDVKCNIMLFIHCYNAKNLVLILFLWHQIILYCIKSLPQSTKEAFASWQPPTLVTACGEPDRKYSG